VGGGNLVASHSDPLAHVVVPQSKREIKEKREKRGKERKRERG